MPDYRIEAMPEQLPAALVEKLQKVETATIGHSQHCGFMDRRIQPLLRGKRIAAAAVTLAMMGAGNPAFNGTQQAFVDTGPWDLNIFEKAAADYSFPYPISKNTAAWNKAENDLLPDAFSGKKPVEEVAKELAKQMNADLAKE